MSRFAVIPQGYVPLYTWFELYYRNHLIRRVWSGMFNPIKSAPGPLMEVFERESDSQGWSIKYELQFFIS